MTGRDVYETGQNRRHFPQHDTLGIVGGGARANSGGGRTDRERTLDIITDRQFRRSSPEVVETAMSMASTWLTFSAENPDVSFDEFLNQYYPDESK